MLLEHGSQQLWVRPNSLASGKLPEDLEAIVAGRPDGVVLPKVSSVRELQEVGRHLDAGGESGTARRRHPRHRDRDRNAAGAAHFGRVQPGNGRSAVGRADVGHGRPVGGHRCLGQDGGGRLTDASVRAGSLVMSCRWRLRRACSRSMVFMRTFAIVPGWSAMWRGRGGMASARSWRSIRIRCRSSTPRSALREAELEHARRVVAAFEASKGAGVTSLDGKMLDRPHLILAQRLLGSRGERPARRAAKKRRLPRGERAGRRAALLLPRGSAQSLQPGRRLSTPASLAARRLRAS